MQETMILDRLLFIYLTLSLVYSLFEQTSMSKRVLFADEPYYPHDTFHLHTLTIFCSGTMVSYHSGLWCIANIIEPLDVIILSTFIVKVSLSACRFVTIDRTISVYILLLVICIFGLHFFHGAFVWLIWWLRGRIEIQTTKVCLFQNLIL